MLTDVNKHNSTFCLQLKDKNLLFNRTRVQWLLCWKFYDYILIGFIETIFQTHHVKWWKNVLGYDYVHLPHARSRVSFIIMWICFSWRVFPVFELYAFVFFIPNLLSYFFLHFIQFEKLRVCLGRHVESEIAEFFSFVSLNRRDNIKFLVSV